MSAHAPYPPPVRREPPSAPSSHAPRILFLYGSLRDRSISKLLAAEAARVAVALGAEARTFDPAALPVCGSVPEAHAEVQRLRELSEWAEAHVWCSPEQHGSMAGVLKNQLDWIPLSIGARPTTQGRTLAVMQVSGGAQSFNAVNAMRLVGRWMRMFAIPSQCVVARAHEQFDENGAMKDSAYRDRVVDVMEELTKLTLVLRDNRQWLADRHSARRTREPGPSV